MYYTVEQKMALALGVNTAPAEVIRERVQVPLPQVTLDPPRTGYGPTDAPTVESCMDLEETYPDSRYDFSGSPAGWAGGTPTPSMGVW